MLGCARGRLVGVQQRARLEAWREDQGAAASQRGLLQTKSTNSRKRMSAARSALGGKVRFAGGKGRMTSEKVAGLSQYKREKRRHNC